MKVDPHLVADPHWRELASVLQDAHDQRLDVPAAITVALEEGPLELADPATDLASRISRLTYPEPFAPDTAGHGDEPRHSADLHHQREPNRESARISW